MIKFTTLLFYFYLLTFICFCGGCAKVYKHPNFKTVKEKHKTMAFLPFSVSYTYFKRPKRLSQEKQKELEQTQAQKMKEELYAYFLENRHSNSAIHFQAPATTDSLLKAAGITTETLPQYKEKELATILGVDAVFRMNISTYFYRQDIEALAIMILTIFSVGTQKITVDANIHDGGSGELLWTYERTFKGGILDSERKKRKIIRRKIKRKFPYRY